MSTAQVALDIAAASLGVSASRRLGGERGGHCDLDQVGQSASSATDLDRASARQTDLDRASARQTDLDRASARQAEGCRTDRGAQHRSPVGRSPHCDSREAWCNRPQGRRPTDLLLAYGLHLFPTQTERSRTIAPADFAVFEVPFGQVRDQWGERGNLLLQALITRGDGKARYSKVIRIKKSGRVP
jgi:hypothetical protein